ncbi:hypothetical protein V7S43_014804 [Phytophthora oleae]|uniref:THH1/TOM1/TOM3 domain-containing protein n=1 Tax=Phytophthora oleae TaxID=2107226 RepID=A0ABD3F2J9_9STRA
MLWQLICAGIYALKCIPIVHGLVVSCSLQRRGHQQLRSFVLARSFHRPLYATCLLLVALRVVFLLLTAINNWEEMDIRLKVATFWLLDMPSVAMAMLHGYIVLFAVHLVFRRRWPGTTNSAVNGGLTALFVVFCASLVALVTLVAVCRAEGDKWTVVPQWMTFGYSAVIWTTLGLLMLKYGGQAVQILWRYRHQRQWNAAEGEERVKKSFSRLPVLSISCLNSLALWTTILAELLVIRGVLCAVAASQSSEGVVDSVGFYSWRTMLLHYIGWEVTSIAIVVRMLSQTPTAVRYFSDELRSAEITGHQDRVKPSAPDFNDGDIQLEFLVPSIRELVSDYVVPSNTAILTGQRPREVEHETIVEHRYCRKHHSDESFGAEYVNCRCYHEHDADPFLSHANVPLLAEEYEPLADGNIACEQ